MLKWSGWPEVAKTGAMSILQHGTKIMKDAKMSIFCIIPCAFNLNSETPQFT